MIKWISKPHGACPVQAEGYFMGYYFYFRSRWQTSSIEFAKTEQDWKDDKLVAYYELAKFDDEHTASWLPHWACRLLIWMGCLKFIFRKK